MKIKCNLVVLLLSFLCMPIGVMAGIIKGSVKDQNHQPISFALVFVEGTSYGTTASPGGTFQLDLPAGTYTLSCQSIGYETGRKKIMVQGDEAQEVNFTLKEQGLNVKEVVVKATDEDPAVRIMRKVIKKRKEHLKQVKSFETDIYLKGVIRTNSAPDKILGQKVEKGDMGLDTSGKGVMYLVEQRAKYYARPDGKTKTIIQSVRESGDPSGLGFSNVPDVISFYENNINIMPDINPRGFISPVNDLALTYYKFKLMGSFLENNKTIYKIRVNPRRDFEPCFRGDIFIADDDWAIHSLDLLVDKRSNLNMLDTLILRQQYQESKKHQWVIKQQVIYPTLKLFGFGFHGYILSVYENQKVNQAIPDSIFNTKYISEYASDANKKDSTYWNDQRLVTLEKDEAKDYLLKDSLYKVQTDPNRIDSLRRKGNRRIDLISLLTSGKTFNTKAYKSSIGIHSLLFAFNYNSIEGLNIAPKLYWSSKIDSFKIISGDVALRYGIANQRFNTIASIKYFSREKAFPSKNFSASLQGGRYVFQYSGFQQITGLLNTYTTLVDGHNFMKLYEATDLALRLRKGFGNGLSVSLMANYQNRNPLQNSTYYTWSKSDGAHFTANYPAGLWSYPWEKHSAFIVEAGVAFKPGVRYVKLPNSVRAISSNWPTFGLRYRKGFKDILESKSDFDQWKASVDGDVGMRMLGKLDFNISGGGFINSKYVSAPDLKHFKGNEILLMDDNLDRFQLMPYYAYSNASPLYGEVHLQWNLQGLLTNKIPLFRKLQWYLVTGTNSMAYQPGVWYSEVFVGLDNIGWKLFRVLRVDVAKSWDSYGKSYTGIRVRLSMPGGTSISMGSNSSITQNHW